MDLTTSNLANYDTEWSAEEYSREPGLRALETELIREYFPDAPAPVLDLGCGAGRTTVGLSELGYRVAGIDLSASLLRRARARSPRLPLLRGDATRLSFRDGSFPAAIFSYNGIDCIYPVESRRRCMAEVFRVLTPGGVFILSSHNFLGAIFSGGYFYLRGYWNAARALARQVGNPYALEGYARYMDGGGPQFLYSATPARTLQQLSAVGFEVLTVRGHDNERSLRRIRNRHQHVHFVARRPAEHGPA